MYAQAPEVGVVDRMTNRPAEQDTRLYNDRVSGAKYELTRIDKNRSDVSSVDQLMTFSILTAYHMDQQRIRLHVDTAAPHQH